MAKNGHFFIEFWPIFDVFFYRLRPYLWSKREVLGVYKQATHRRPGDEPFFTLESTVHDWTWPKNGPLWTNIGRTWQALFFKNFWHFFICVTPQFAFSFFEIKVKPLMPSEPPQPRQQHKAGKDPATTLDDFLEIFQTAFDPPLIFGKLYCNFFYNGYGCIYARRYDGQIVWNACTWFPEICVIHGNTKLLLKKHTRNPESWNYSLVSIHAQKPCLKSQNLQYKFLDWKWPPPPLALYQKFIRFGSQTLPLPDQKSKK